MLLSLTLGLVGCSCKHEWVETSTIASTCTTDGKFIYTCSKCKETKEEIIVAGHNWIDASCTEPKHCTKCGEIEGVALGHTTRKGKCDRCGEEIVYTLDDLTADLKKVDSSVQVIRKAAEMLGAEEGYGYVMSDGTFEVYKFDIDSASYKAAFEKQELFLESFNYKIKAVVKNGYAFFISEGTCENAMAYIDLLMG